MIATTHQAVIDLSTRLLIGALMLGALILVGIGMDLLLNSDPGTVSFQPS